MCKKFLFELGKLKGDPYEPVVFISTQLQATATSPFVLHTVSITPVLILEQ